MVWKKPLPQPNACRGHVVQVLHRKSGGATYGAQKIILTTKRMKEETLIKLNNWVYITIIGCLKARVGGN